MGDIILPSEEFGIKKYIFSYFSVASSGNASRERKNILYYGGKTYSEVKRRGGKTHEEPHHNPSGLSRLPGNPRNHGRWSLFYRSPSGNHPVE
jgi:hypothetical protein